MLNFFWLKHQRRWRCQRRLTVKLAKQSTLWWLLPKECHKPHPLYLSTPPSSQYFPVATLSLTPLAATERQLSPYPTFCFLASEDTEDSLPSANLPRTLITSYSSLGLGVGLWGLVWVFGGFLFVCLNCSLLPAAGEGKGSLAGWGDLSSPAAQQALPPSHCWLRLPCF